MPENFNLNKIYSNNFIQKLHPDKQYTSEDAFIEYFNRESKADIGKMSLIYDIPVINLIKDLGDEIYQNPEKLDTSGEYKLEEGWEIRSQYLSGDISKKLISAVQANKKFPGCFERNIKALKKKLPQNVDFENITFQIGAPWLGEELYELLIKRIFSFIMSPKVTFSKSGVWKITPPAGEERNMYNTYIYAVRDGSEIRITGCQLLENYMNGKTTVIRDYEKNNIINKALTLTADEKIKNLSADIKNIIKNDEKLRSFVAERYNAEFVSYCTTANDGRFLRLSDLNREVKLFKNQLSVLARILTSEGNILVSHEVGAGKNFIIPIAAHELYKRGHSKKIMIVLPNNVIKATADTHKSHYPDDNILVIYPGDFTPSYRREILEKVKMSTHTAIYIAYSSFDMIVMSKNHYINKYTSEITKKKLSLRNVTDKKESNLIKSEIKKAEKKRTKILEERFDPDYPCYEELGIDTLFIDEMHSYKNIEIKSSSSAVVGIHSKGSKKCMECLEKVHFTRRLIAFTGTPLTNSMTDLYAMQLFLQPEALKYHDILNFDNWVNTFSKKEELFEIDVKGGLKITSRYTKFFNIRELSSLFGTVCDFYKGPDGEKVKPDAEYHKIIIPADKTQKDFFKALAQRADDIHSKKVGRCEDNFLKITVHGRLFALDRRLLDESFPPAEPEYSKICVCAANIAKIYRENPHNAQAVFADTGTPKDKFNVYDALADELSDLGIERSKIAFIHDAADEGERTVLFENINTGRIKVIIGSSQKLGTGTNIQRRLSAIHHLDVPWYPSHIIQREGRAIRRGNTCNKVHIYIYVSEGSFDSYNWQLIESKQRFLTSFFSGISPENDADDISAVLTYSEIKALALGSSLIRDRIEAYNLLERTNIASRQRKKQLCEMKKIIESAPAKIKKLKNLINICMADIEHYSKSKETVPQKERMAFGEELLSELNSSELRTKEGLFCKYQGFDVVLPLPIANKPPFVYVRSPNGGKYALKMDTDKPMGVCMRLDYLLESGLKKQIQNHTGQIVKIKKESKEAQKEEEKGNPYAKKAQELSERLRLIDKKLEEQEE